ncbi:MAG: mechanosensitive ion channel family protein [Eubacterium sp.]|nr:mechanosensitive ion channel family protein [Eubacterium sp.]
MQEALKNADFSLSHIIISLCVIGVAIIVWMVFKRLYNRHVEQHVAAGGNRPTTLFYNAARAIVVILVILAVLQINEINVTSLVAGLGIASAIVGLALQDYLKDIIMGTHIVRDSFFKEGDVVKYGDQEGVVIEFNMRTTKIRCFSTGNILTVSNRNISEISVVPESQFQDIDIGLPYEEDHQRVFDVLAKACGQIAQLDGVDDCVMKGILKFEDSDILYRVRFFCYPSKKYDLRLAANRIILECLTEAGISIPYPQIDVHMNQ